MKTIASHRTITASADGTGLLSHAGSLLLLKTLHVTGLDRALSAQLERWRPARAVHESLTKTVRHASVGELTLDCDILAALGTDLRIMTFTVAEGSETAERLRLLEVVGAQV
ncbi:hypothetical protein OIE67_21285 [Nonomuraea fuscirosea]|uniref:MmyB family transcriptional regulator n=1 Tax=Nonomuraea fuscirosea TaxID=1291556 RepID=UPI002DD8E98B|nr:hypothetical protein [Nonomuraea fuscirosea]WSA57051.1 hypothetical protein OIE67_21285 [Nonomuraea fuscirosea]